MTTGSIEMSASRNAIAEALCAALDIHEIPAEVTVHEKSTLVLSIPDPEGLEAAVRMCGLLGAPHIGSGLALRRPSGMRRLADRMTWLLAGVTGSPVRVEGKPGSISKERVPITIPATLDMNDRMVTHLTSQQARNLIARLAAATPEESLEDCLIEQKETGI
ncbi:hypothetical protein [Streptomyces sp. NPDC050560]|uniref:hypothetical protein n=1 Tax=Streptomyces sp. NPDC050560 TaxID=3365630 RepID=UPI00378D9E29